MKQTNHYEYPREGIIPPMVSPLRDDDTLDRDGLERLIEHILAAEVAGLFLLGTSGEGASLSHATQKELVQHASRQVDGRVPLLVSITDTSLAESLQSAHFCADAGIQGLVLSLPYYYPLRQKEVLDYVGKVMDQSPLPLFLYNIPSHTKTAFSIETLKRLMEWRYIVGIKDSSGDMAYFRELLQLRQLRPDWTIFMGPETFLAEAIQLGAQGGISGGANLYPHVFVDLYQASVNGDQKKIEVLQHLVQNISQKIYDLDNDGYIIQGLKYALSCLGICSSHVASPMPQLPPGRQKEIQKSLYEIEAAYQSTTADTPRHRIIEITSQTAKNLKI